MVKIKCQRVPQVCPSFRCATSHAPPPRPPNRCMCAVVFKEMGQIPGGIRRASGPEERNARCLTGETLISKFPVLRLDFDTSTYGPRMVLGWSPDGARWSPDQGLRSGSDPGLGPGTICGPSVPSHEETVVERGWTQGAGRKAGGKKKTAQRPKPIEFGIYGPNRNEFLKGKIIIL